MVTRAIFVVGLILYSLIVVIADAYLETALGIASVVNAGVGLVVGFGFLVPMTFNIAIDPLYSRQFGTSGCTPHAFSKQPDLCIPMFAIPI